MIDTVRILPSASRLVRRLSEWDVSGTPALPGHFAERFAQLVDFSGAVTVSKILGRLPEPTGEPTAKDPAAVKAAFLDRRAGLVRDVVKRFVPRAGPSRLRLPTVVELHGNCLRNDAFSLVGEMAVPNCAAAFAPYRRLYIALQGKLALESHRLRLQTAEAAAGISPALAGLAALDKGLNEAIYQSQRRIFDRIPTFIELHFNHRLRTHWQTLAGNPQPCDLAPWMSPGGWIAEFCGQMRELLLAELDLRLQPAIGFIEALYETGRIEPEPDENQKRNRG